MASRVSARSLAPSARNSPSGRGLDAAYALNSADLTSRVRGCPSPSPRLAAARAAFATRPAWLARRNEEIREVDPVSQGAAGRLGGGGAFRGVQSGEGLGAQVEPLGHVSAGRRPGVGPVQRRRPGVALEEHDVALPRVQRVPVACAQKLLQAPGGVPEKTPGLLQAPGFPGPGPEAQLRAQAGPERQGLPGPGAEDGAGQPDGLPQGLLGLVLLAETREIRSGIAGIHEDARGRRRSGERRFGVRCLKVLPRVAQRPEREVELAL
jgi:hypothetical protein